MAKRIYYKRHNRILNTESVIFSAIISGVLYSVLHVNWSICIISLIALPFIFFYLFFEFRLFRYLITVLFSIGWGLVFFGIGRAFDNEDPTAAIVFSIVSYIASIYLHREQFDFINGAKIIEYDSY